MIYTIAFSTESINDITEKVNTLIADGWKPQGGISTVSHVFAEIEQSPTILYLQAMIKD